MCSNARKWGQRSVRKRKIEGRHGVVGGHGQWRRIPGSGRTAFARPWVVPTVCVGSPGQGQLRGWF